MRRFIFAMLLGAGILVGADPPVLSGSQPGLLDSNPYGEMNLTLQGINLVSRASAYGTDDYTFNTHTDRYVQVELVLRTAAGPQWSKQHVCSGASDSFVKNQCSITGLGPSSISLNINPLKFPDWNSGLSLIARVREFYAESAGGRAAVAPVGSNTIEVPFSRPFAQPPVITGVSPASFTSTAKDWSVKVAARNTDLTANVDVDGVPAPDAKAEASSDGTGTVTFTVPPAARRTGAHPVRVCRWAPDVRGGGKATCSAPANYEVAMIYTTLPGRGINDGATGSSISSLASPTTLQTITCPTTPLYADLRGTEVTSQGRPLVARSGQSFWVFEGNRKGSSGALRELDLGAPVFVAAACLK